MNFTPQEYAIALENERERRQAVQSGQAIMVAIVLFGGIALLVNMCSPKSPREIAMQDCIESTVKAYGPSVSTETVRAHCRSVGG